MLLGFFDFYQGAFVASCYSGNLAVGLFLCDREVTARGLSGALRENTPNTGCPVLGYISFPASGIFAYFGNPIAFTLPLSYVRIDSPPESCGT